MRLWSTEIRKVSNISSDAVSGENRHAFHSESMLDTRICHRFSARNRYSSLSYYLLFHMLFLMLCVLQTRDINLPNTIMAFHGKVSSYYAREARVSDRFLIRGRIRLSLSLSLTCWYLRNMICKTSVFGDTCKRARRANCNKTEARDYCEIIALTMRGERVSVRRQRHWRAGVPCTYIPRIASSTSRYSSAAP